MELFIDESGDLRNYENDDQSSRYFALSGLICEKPEKIAKIVENHLFGEDELKFTNATPEIKERVLKAIGKRRQECIIRTVIIDKNSIIKDHNFRKNPDAFYFWVTKQLFSMLTPYIKDSITIYFDKRYFNLKREQLNNTVKNVISSISPTIEHKIIHEDSKKELCLSAIDMICGAIRNEYVYGNDKYSGLLKNNNIKTIKYFKIKR
ncbi:MAG: DUF3800 domain-containing protein [Nanoarchaeota archaeon]|nr:DUF3800 domain-containing protein [Nanoarchaeota archaeon]